MRISGEYAETAVAGETVRAFVPAPLPPVPALDTRPILALYNRARGAIGQLDGVTTVLPSMPLFLFMYVRKEALFSSQIEGTQSSLSDLLLFENDEIPQIPIDDVTEVSNYVAAIEHGIARMRGGFPLSLRLIREMHEILLRSGRGASKQPGEFRTSQNWIGGTRPGNALFVPPPPNRLLECLGDFETFCTATIPRHRRCCAPGSAIISISDRSAPSPPEQAPRITVSASAPAILAKIVPRNATRTS